MQIYYLNRPCTLSLAHKSTVLHAPSPDALSKLRIPTVNIYCGNVGWEIMLARAQLGDEAVVIQELTPEIAALLPPRIGSYKAGGDLCDQVRALLAKRESEKCSQPFRIALMNGLGTMLGDTLVGSRALEIAVEKLTAEIGHIEVHVVLAWNARPGTEEILRRSPAVSSLQEHSLTLDELRQFDAYWDFSELLRMEGYDTLPLIDFYLEHLAINPDDIVATDKLPQLRLPATVRSEAKKLLEPIKHAHKLLLLQWLASTPLRSMPDQFVALLLEDILRETEVCVLVTQPLPAGIVVNEPDRVVQLAEWCATKTDNYLALFAEIDAVISVDTLAIHAALAEKKPGLGIFTTIAPELRLPPASQIKGYMILGAEDLPLWGRHKDGADWESNRSLYEAAWLALDRPAILASIRSALEKRMSAAIYYHPEAYTTVGPKLMGRNAAGESFLRGLLQHSQSTEFWVQVQAPEHAQHFAQCALKCGRTEPIRAVDKSSMAALAQPGVVFYPSPGIGELAYHRAALGGNGGWSLCGITYTTSSAAAMDSLVDLITAPVQPWDALICTSTAVKDNVSRLLQGQVDFLKDRLGITKLVLPQMPVIPLGIHTQDFVSSAEQKSAARKALAVDEQTLVVFFMGRLSFHAKAHPLVMYQALEQAAQESNKQVVLVECGWFANESIEKAYAEAARQTCPSVRIVTLDGRKAEERTKAWASADVFCSLADNIQETFGITPIEAMAAGLPVVVSDWDGYKDTVRDGVDGFRIPTLMPQAGLGGDLALRHAFEIDTYDMYCGHTCTLVSIDVQATARAFVKLFGSPTLRKQMGESGRLRAQEIYDWAKIIPQYEALWEQLKVLRSDLSKTIKPLAHPWPARMDPFHIFASYPTLILNTQTMLSMQDQDIETSLKRIEAYAGLGMVSFAQAVLPEKDEIRAVLTEALSGPKTAEALIAHISTQRKPYVLRSLAWLVKMGILKTIQSAPPSHNE